MSEFLLYIKEMAAIASESLRHPKTTTEIREQKSQTLSAGPGNRLLAVDRHMGEVKLFDDHGNLDI
jgi:hypothetical protein